MWLGQVNEDVSVMTHEESKTASAFKTEGINVWNWLRGR